MTSEKDKLARYWYEQGHNYYESSKLLLKYQNQQTIFPVLTLLAFSSECFFKTLLTLTNVKIKRFHELEKLFNALPSDVKDQISNEFLTTYHHRIDLCLIQNSKTFIDSRYFLTETTFIDSGQAQPFHLGTLEILCEFLYNFIKHNGETIKYNYK